MDRQATYRLNRDQTGQIGKQWKKEAGEEVKKEMHLRNFSAITCDDDDGSERIDNGNNNHPTIN